MTVSISGGGKKRSYKRRSSKRRSSKRRSSRRRSYRKHTPSYLYTHDNDNNFTILFDKMFSWWLKLSDEDKVIIIYTDGTYDFGNGIYHKNLTYENDPNVKHVIWSSRSSDALHNFVTKIINTVDSNTVNTLAKSSSHDTLMFVLLNYTNLLRKHKLYGSKDYLI